MVERRPAARASASAASRARAGELAGSDRPTPNFVSHTTPLTVAAELGVVGLLLYAWLLVGGARLIAAGAAGASGRSGLALAASLPRAVRARALLQRLPRGSDHLARARRRRRLAVLAGGPARPPAERSRRRAASIGMRAERARRPRGAWALVGVLFALVAITLPELGSDPWHFRPGAVDPQGPLGAAGARGGRGVGPGHPARLPLPRRPAVRRGARCC